MLVSPRLLDELADVLSRSKFRRWLTEEEADAFLSSIRLLAEPVADPDSVLRVSPDPDDDYLVALGVAARADALVSGDRHLSGLILDPPVETSATFLSRLQP